MDEGKMIISLDKLESVILTLEKLKLNYKIFYTKTEEILKKSADELIPCNDKSIHVYIYVIMDNKNILIPFTQLN